MLQELPELLSHCCSFEVFIKWQTGSYINLFFCPEIIEQKLSIVSPRFGTRQSRIEDFTKQAINMALFKNQ